MRDDTSIWFQQAQRDLFVAEQTFKIELYEVVLLFCQQAIEKALKALYIEQNGRLAPRTHSLLELIDLVDLEQASLISVASLEDYYFQLRYPEADAKIPPYAGVGREESEMGLQFAQEAMAVLEEILTSDEAGTDSSTTDEGSQTSSE